MAAHGRWYIAGRDPRYLRRNALVALGNVGDGTDPDTVRARPLAVGRRRRCSSSTPGGRPDELGRDDLVVRRRRGDPSLGHQRLPAEGRGDPGLPLGAVAASRPRFVRGTHRQLPPRRRRLRSGAGRARRPHRAGVGPVLVPGPPLVRRIREAARRIDADLVVLDPAFPLGLVGPRLRHPLCRACCTVPRWPSPGGCPVGRELVAHVLGHSALAVSAGGYPAAEARRTMRRGARMPPMVEIPPGVDLQRFRPLPPGAAGLGPCRVSGCPAEGPLVVSVSRLVPRKGMDVLIDAAVRLRAEVPGPDRGHRRSWPGLRPAGRQDRRVPGAGPTAGRRVRRRASRD